jgi:A/G-specific adenine glycosylase
LTGSLPADSALRRKLHTDLLRWFDGHQRRLPWRLRPSLYGTWIAEIMLQQTTVKAVLPYWERFLSRWPDVRALAAADPEEVLALWSGLGYYRRARALHAAARLIAAGGQVTWPADRDAWLGLPGIGLYTASAIASIGQGQRVGAVDANVRRVLQRWFGDSAGEVERWEASRPQRLADWLVPEGRPGDWNQAVMELGALICLPALPRCRECPVACHCRAHQCGWAGRRLGAVRPGARPVWLSVLALRGRQGVLLVPGGGSPVLGLRGWGRPVRRNFDGLLEGLWQLPGSPWYAVPVAGRGRIVQQAWQASLLSAWRRWLVGCGGGSTARLTTTATLSHAITSYRLRLSVVSGTIDSRTLRLPAGGRWFDPAMLADAPLSALARKALATVGEAPVGPRRL